MFRSVLQITDNNEHALIENADGRLTERQRQRLLAELRAARPIKWGIEAAGRTIKLLDGMLLAGLFLSVVALLFLNLVVFRGSIALQIVLTIMTLLLGVPLLSYQRRLSEWRAISQQFENGDYQIWSYQGQIKCAIYPDPRGHVYGDKYVVSTADHEFEVSQALYEYIRPYSDDVTLYYLTDPFTTLLSIEPTPMPEAPTDDELARVVSVGDDGELVYEDDVDERKRAS